jgi:hypothetical protein
MQYITRRIRQTIKEDQRTDSRAEKPQKPEKTTKQKTG